MAGAVERKELHVEERGAWRAWLEAHHASSPGVWLVSWKPHTARPSVSYEDAILEALCFGWVDSQSRSIDHDRSALTFTPRKPGSLWAGTNKARVLQLEAAGLMRDPGRAVIELAKASGTWELLDGPEAGIVPDDLAEALAAQPPSREVFDAFSPGVRKGMLTWLVTAKRPQTRANRIAEIAGEAAQGRRAGQWAG